MDIQIAILITPTKLLADSPRKIRSIPKFFLLYSYPQKPFYPISLRGTIWQTASVLSKWTRFCPPSVKTRIQNKKILRFFLPQVVHLVVLNAVFWHTPRSGSAERTENFNQRPVFFSFFFSCSKKVFLGLFFATRLDNLLRIADKKTKFRASNPKTKKKQDGSFLRKSLSNSAIWSFWIGERWFVNCDEI